MVVAGSIGALMALLDISVVNSALPTIQGEIGATGNEGTWIATAYLVAEIIVIPLTAWLERMLGLRTLLLIATIMFTIFSVICGTATDLTTMILGRTGQGIGGGVLIPTAMTIVAKRLPPEQQSIGTALFGLTAILGPVLGPLVGGWLTENISWHYAFFINVPIAVVQVSLLLVAAHPQKPDWSELSQADWLGIAGMALGLGGLTVVLEDGQREQWFESAFIVRLAVVSFVGFLLLAAGQLFASRPVIRLKLLLGREFGSVAVLSVVLGIVLYGTPYVIPQFVSAIANYNALQAGVVLLLTGVPTLVLMPIVPVLMSRGDVRLVVGFGFSVMALSCWIDSDLTAASDGTAFTMGQLLRGVGTTFTMMFLNQSAIRAVPAKYAGDAAGLFNAARNLGGSVGLAMLATIQDQRVYMHARRIEESLPANAVGVQSYMAGQIGALGSPEAAFQSLGGLIQREALVMTYNDIFWLLSVGIIAVTPLVLFLRPLPKGAPVATH
jgi:DHA2 family multidrug resistance protein